MAGPESSLKISAYVPCYNNAETVGQAIKSLQAQTVAIDEIFVIDDCSTDDSVKVATDCDVRVIANEKHVGRGAVRAQAMRTARNEFVLCVDASKVVSPKFLEQALTWNLSGKVAGVFGRIVLNHTKTMPERWANRHIYEVTANSLSDSHGLLVTAGCLLRKSVVLELGNFNRFLQHSEDRELGRRLLAANYEVIFDPLLAIVDTRHKSLREALETYWRWHAGEKECVDMQAYLRQIIYSFKVLAGRDIKSGDLASVFISFVSPHYQLWRSLTGSKNKELS